MKQSNAYDHRKEIFFLFKRGWCVTKIANRYHCNLQVIRKILLEKYSHEEYRKIVKSKTGAGAPSRKKVL